MSASPEQHDRGDRTDVDDTLDHTVDHTLERDADAAPVPDPFHLSERDLHILDFERRWWRHAGAKEEAIRTEFDLSAARYYQLLNAVIDLPGAARTDPMLVKRLQRARSDRMRARSAHAFTFSSTSETTSESND